MNPTIVIWILAAVLCLMLGRELGKWMFGANEKLLAKKRAAQVLAVKLRAAGMKRLPKMLEDFAMGDVNDMLVQIEDLAKLVDSGSDAIEKELEATYENVLVAKMKTPEGMALIKAKMAEVEQPAEAAPVAAPLAAPK